MHEYAFDVKMYAVVRIISKDRDTAERVLEEVLDEASLQVGFEYSASDGGITSALVYMDDVDFPLLVEYNGVDVETDDTRIV